MFELILLEDWEDLWVIRADFNATRYMEKMENLKITKSMECDKFTLEMEMVLDVDLKEAEFTWFNNQPIPILSWLEIFGFSRIETVL